MTPTEKFTKVLCEKILFYTIFVPEISLKFIFNNKFCSENLLNLKISWIGVRRHSEENKPGLTKLTASGLHLMNDWMNGMSEINEKLLARFQLQFQNHYF